MTTKTEFRAPAVALKLEAARGILQDLESETGQAALDASENAPGAVKRLADLRVRITNAERDVADLTKAQALASQIDREAVAAARVKMRREQLAAFKGHVVAREKFMLTALEHAAAMAAAYTAFQFESEAMISVLPSGTSFPAMAMGENGISGNLLGSCERLLLAEMYRIGAKHDERGRRAILPFAKPQVVALRDEPDKIRPSAEVLKEAHAAVLREIEGQIERLNSETVKAATGVAA
jgi:hypothetical protein